MIKHTSQMQRFFCTTCAGRCACLLIHLIPLRVKVIRLQALFLKLPANFQGLMNLLKAATLNSRCWKWKRTGLNLSRFLSMTKEMKTNLLLFLVIVCILSCNSDYVARPRGYFKISLPEKKYQLFDRKGFPYTFEY